MSKVCNEKWLNAYLLGSDLMEYEIKIYKYKDSILCDIYEMRTNDLLDGINTFEELLDLYGDEYWDSLEDYAAGKVKSLREYFSNVK